MCNQKEKKMKEEERKKKKGEKRERVIPLKTIKRNELLKKNRQVAKPFIKMPKE